MPTKKEEAFRDSPSLKGDLNEVPGLGDAGIKNLQAKGIKTTYQLIGHFLNLNRNEADMIKFLIALDNRKNPEQYVENTARAIKERVANKGFKCDIRLSDHVIKTATSMFNDAKKTDFLQKKLTGKLSDDFFGIKNEAGFKEAGIETSDHLFGEFLRHIDDPDPSKNTDKCDEFYARLVSLGASPGHKSAIIYQLQAKLGVGIDTHGPEALKLPMPTLAEAPEDAIMEDEFDKMNIDPPGTGGKSRTGRKKPVD